MSKKSIQECALDQTSDITLRFEGLRIVGSSVTLAGGKPSVHRKTALEQYVCGTHFYRPPDPPITQRREMLRAIAQTHQFNTIRVFPSWAYCNPEPDRFEFGELDELFGYCDEFGLKVLMGVMLEDAPFWLEHAHPETRCVNAGGVPRRLGGASNNVSAGAPGLCLDWNPVREAASRYIRAMVKMSSSHPSLFAYDCWNEPHNEPTGHALVGSPFDIEKSLYCYCSRTIEAFQDWLECRYGTLRKLEEAWTRRYPSFSAIDPPRRPGVYKDWVDWLSFLIDRATSELRFRAAEVRAVDQQSVLECHMGLQLAVDTPAAVLGANPWQLAKEVQVWGTSYFVGLIPDVFWGAARLELTRSQANGKPFWMTEFQGGAAGGNLSQARQLRRRDIRLGNWLAVATGAKGTIYWTYYPGTHSWESGAWAMVRPDGTPTERVAEASETHRLIQAYWEVIGPYKPKVEVALLFDQDTALLTFAMTKDEVISTNSFRGYYKALWNCDVWVDFIEPERLDGSAYKVIVAPWYLMAKNAICEQLRRFVETGGTLILQTGFGMHDERAALSPTMPPYGLDEAFGYREEESFFLPEQGINEIATVAGSFNSTRSGKNLSPTERVYTEGHLTFTDPIEVSIKARNVLTPVSALDGATVVATYESMAVATKKRLGRGQVYFIGTNLGAAINFGEQGGIDLVRNLLWEAGVKPAVAGNKIRPRLIEGKKQSLLVVFNDTAEDQTENICLPPRYRSAIDLYRNKSMKIDRGLIAVTVPYEDVTVLRLE